jgi:hypothetical protein
VPQIEVTFDIDANGIVNVSAKDKGTGKEHQIRIQASGGLSDADIEKMVKDAESHAAEDKQRRELVEARNQAEALAHSAEKSLKDYGDKVSADDRKAIEDALAALKSAAEGDDAGEIKARPARRKPAKPTHRPMHPVTTSSTPISRKSTTTAATTRRSLPEPRDDAGKPGLAPGFPYPAHPSPLETASGMRLLWYIGPTLPKSSVADDGRPGELPRKRHEGRFLRDAWRRARRGREGAEERVPQARHAVPPRPQPRRRGLRAQVQGNQRGL